MWPIKNSIPLSQMFSSGIGRGRGEPKGKPTDLEKWLLNGSGGDGSCSHSSSSSSSSSNTSFPSLKSTLNLTKITFYTEYSTLNTDTSTGEPFHSNVKLEDECIEHGLVRRLRWVMQSRSEQCNCSTTHISTRLYPTIHHTVMSTLSQTRLYPTIHHTVMSTLSQTRLYPTIHHTVMSTLSQTRHCMTPKMP